MTTTETKYMIVGGGMAADAAVREILSQEPDASIVLLSAESHLPYDRPPLSKSLITDPDMQVDDVIHDPEPYSNKVKCVLGEKARRIESESKKVFDEHGNEYHYQKLLLATGGRPKHLAGDPEGVSYYRNLSDFKRLQEDIAMGNRVGIVGSGFIGCELAASLSDTACNPFMIFPESYLGADRYPEGLGKYVTEVYREKGIDLLPEQSVVGVEAVGDHYTVITDGGGRYAADHVVAGLGIQPNVALASEAGLKVEDGIQVNAALQTSDPAIFAAGDVASVYRKALGRFERVEHEQNAVQMGQAAGSSMTGQEVAFECTPMFYSDFFDLGFEAIGDLDPSMDMVEDWQDGYKQGVVYYLKDNHVQGVLLWNIFGKIEQARDLMQQDRITPEELQGAIQP